MVKGGSFTYGGDGWRCRRCELLFPQTVDIWCRWSLPEVRDVSMFGLG